MNPIGESKKDHFAPFLDKFSSLFRMAGIWDQMDQVSGSPSVLGEDLVCSLLRSIASRIKR